MLYASRCFVQATLCPAFVFSNVFSVSVTCTALYYKGGILYNVCCSVIVLVFSLLHLLNMFPSFTSGVSASITRMVKSRRMRRVGYVARIGRKRNAYELLVGEPDGKGPLGRPRRTSEDSIKMAIGEIG
jgi:hypothetical protein